MNDRKAATSEREEHGRGRPVGPWLGFAVIVAAGLYRPIVLWAENAWEVSNPARLILVGFVVAAIAAVPYLLLIRIGVQTAAAAVSAAGLVVVVMNWHRMRPSPLLWIAGLAIAGWAIHRHARSEIQRMTLVVAIAVLFVAPVVQLAVAHVQRAERYPIVELAERQSAEATGNVEDVVFVIVDGYPSLALAEEWFSHEPSELQTRLEELEFTVEPSAWSQATYTALSIPSILELQPVVEPGPKGAWGNRMSTYEIIRGESFVAETLRSAGFEYTHIEGGWDAASCGKVDVCLEATWLDELTWELLRPGIAAGLMESRFGYPSPINSLRAVEHLEEMRADFDDGERDYVFAHVPLPHAPFLADADCTVPPFDQRTDESIAFEVRVARQLTCVDTLITRIAELVGPKTAVIITGDHGTAIQGQLSVNGTDWSDAEIAERLGVFLAYRLPSGCEDSDATVNVDVMRAIMSCALSIDLPERNAGFLIGANEPVLIAPERMAGIQREVAAGDVPERAK